MIRYTILVMALASFISPAFAEQDIPTWCCPSTCQVIDGSTDEVSSTDERGATDFSHNEKTIPFSNDLYRGNAPDGLTRVCIGFNTFGDPEIKCIFSPLPLI